MLQHSKLAPLLKIMYEGSLLTYLQLTQKSCHKMKNTHFISNQTQLHTNTTKNNFIPTKLMSRDVLMQSCTFSKNFESYR